MFDKFAAKWRRTGYLHIFVLPPRLLRCQHDFCPEVCWLKLPPFPGRLLFSWWGEWQELRLIKVRKRTIFFSSRIVWGFNHCIQDGNRSGGVGLICVSLDWNLNLSCLRCGQGREEFCKEILPVVKPPFCLWMCFLFTHVWQTCCEVAQNGWAAHLYIYIYIDR